MPDVMPYVPTIIMAAVAAAIILACIILYKLLGGRVRGRRGSRLGISEYQELDKMRRLVLVRRDEVEHLLLIGGGQDVVVESGIGSANVVPVVRPAPRPATFAPRRPILRPVEPSLENDPAEMR